MRISRHYTHAQSEENTYEYTLSGPDLHLALSKLDAETVNIGGISTAHAVVNFEDQTWGIDNYSIKIDTHSGNNIIVQKKIRSYGETDKDAQDNIKGAIHTHTFVHDTMYFNPYIILDETHKFRNQSVQYTIRIPSNSVIHYDDDLRSHIH